MSTSATACALLLLKKVDGGWEPDGPGMLYQDDLAHTARWKAAAYGEQWAAKDPGRRQYRVDDCT